MSKNKIFSAFLFAFSTLFADEIRLQDGSLIKGIIREVTQSQIVIETGFAGTLRVDRKSVSGFSSDDPVFAEQPATPTVTVAPVHVVTEEIPSRDWKYKLVAQFSGKSGNSDENAMGMDLSAILSGKRDELKLYGSYDSKESNGEKSSDERQVGVRYTSYFNDPWGWYVRQEFSEDQFKNIKLRSISALGVSYRKMKGKIKQMGFNAGVSYRHEMYVEDSPDSSNLGLDLGLENFIGADRRFELHNEFTLVPSLENASSYLFTQNSYMDVPLNDSKRWKVRLGLRNDYNSLPAGDRERLDTSYYSSLVAEWE